MSRGKAREGEQSSIAPAAERAVPGLCTSRIALAAAHATDPAAMLSLAQLLAVGLDAAGESFSVDRAFRLVDACMGHSWL
jgi:hypothetical protein